MIKDIIYDTSAPIGIDGDWIVDGSEPQHIEDIIVTNKGEFRQFPLIGVGGYNFINASIDLNTIRKRINVQLTYDNFKVEEIVRDASTGAIRVIARQNEQDL